MNTRTLVAAFAAGLVLAAAPGWAPAQETVKKLPQQSAEKKFTMELKTNRESKVCYPTASVEYSQRNDVAEVNGSLSVDECEKASGTYRVSVRIRDDDGTMTNLEFEESWSRDDPTPLAIQHEYPIGENVDLIRVRLRSKRCSCEDDANTPE